jgi:SAM-dependent methyltransferase
MENHETRLLAGVADYYSDKLARHGETPRGVDWNGEESQILRFEQLCKIIRVTRGFSINDLGCGYGALHDFLTREYGDFSYAGFDIAEGMIAAAADRHHNTTNARFVLASEPDGVADYCLTSGVFNVRLEYSDADWQNYVEAVLDTLNRTSRLGFSFNCLTSYSDADKMRNYLYYPDPRMLFDLCKRRYSRNVALLHDYDLYEFTILVRKTL